MLEAAHAGFSEVLDLYAGTGALGIEALSRGDGRCTFVERDRRACAIVRENLERAGFSGRGSVVCERVGVWRADPGITYTLVLADPPYAAGAEAWRAIEATLAGTLGEHATLAMEHAARVHPPPTLVCLPLWRTRRQGDGAVALYRAPQGDARDREDAT